MIDLRRRLGSLIQPCLHGGRDCHPASRGRARAALGSSAPELTLASSAPELAEAMAGERSGTGTRSGLALIRRPGSQGGRPRRCENGARRSTCSARGALAMVRDGRFAPTEARASLETSLRELGTDHVDVLLRHECIPEDLGEDGLLEILHDVVREGRFGASGPRRAPRRPARSCEKPRSFLFVGQCAAEGLPLCEAGESKPFHAKLPGVVRESSA